MVRYLYTGFRSRDPNLVTSGTLKSTRAVIFRGEVERPHKSVAPHTPLDTLGQAETDTPWVRGPVVDTANYVTGGLTDDVTVTRRFMDDAWMYAVVDTTRVSATFSRIEYTQPYYTKIPGAHSHVYPTKDAEVHLDGLGMWGACERRPNTPIDLASSYEVTRWGAGPGGVTSGAPYFKKEREYLAEARDVDVSNAIPAVVMSIDVGKLIVKEVPDTTSYSMDMDLAAYVQQRHKRLVKRLDGYSGDTYLVVMNGGDGFPVRAPDPDNVEYVYDGDLFISVEDVPPQYLGVQPGQYTGAGP